MMSLRYANCKWDLLFGVSISFPDMKTIAGWLLRVTLPSLLLTHSFKLTSEIADEVLESLGFSFSFLRYIALVLLSSPGNSQLCHKAKFCH